LNLNPSVAKDIALGKFEDMLQKPSQREDAPWYGSVGTQGRSSNPSLIKEKTCLKSFI
jgi:hypothetical protein